MNIISSKINQCRICKSMDLEFLLSLGVQPLTGVFVKPWEPDPVKSPLDLIICNDCKFVQLAHTVKPDLMYKSYWYRSGINQTMKDHLTGIIKDIKSRITLEQGDVCIDIGCNDGTLLNAYPDNNLVKIGVDPSDAIDSISTHDVVKIKDIFSENVVAEALSTRKAKIITCISMFYDVHQPGIFVEDIANLLDPEGLWIVEMNYTGDMINSCGYDMISHEHLAYYTMTVFEKLILPYGLYINDVSLNSINGGSIRIFVGFSRNETGNVAKLRQQELTEGLDKKETYINFAKNMEISKHKLNTKIKQIIASGKKVYAYGASTRGNTILLYCGLDNKVIPGAAERNPLKYGLETAGTRIPINSEADIRALNPEYFLILPYTFLNEFIKREKKYLDKGGRFLVPVPEIKVVYKKNGKIVHELID